MDSRDRTLAAPVDERRHSAASTVTAIGEKPLRLSRGTIFTAMDRGDSRGGQPHPHESVKVGLPAATIVGPKAGRRFRIKCNERVSHIIANLE